MEIKKILLGLGLIILILGGFVFAGNLDNSDAPGPVFYTLQNIYDKLHNTATTTAEGDHAFTPSGEPASSQVTLTEIWDSIQLVDPDSITLPEGYYPAANLSTVDPDLIGQNIKAGTNIFGVDGTY
jgi:hypothetical protein